MKLQKLAMAAVASFALLSSACDSPKPAPARRIDHDLKNSNDPDEQVKLLRDAQQRYGKDAPKK